MRDSHQMPPAASSAPETMIGRVPVRTNIFVATVEPNPMPTLTGTYESPDSSWE
jgi:hypothetical protein